MANKPPSGMASIHELGDRMLMQVAEALVFAADRPVAAREIARAYSDVTGNDAPSDGDVLGAVATLNEVYEASGRVFRIERWAAGFRMATISSVAPYLKSFFNREREQKLSPLAHGDPRYRGPTGNRSQSPRSILCAASIPAMHWASSWKGGLST